MSPATYIRNQAGQTVTVASDPRNSYVFTIRGGWIKYSLATIFTFSGTTYTNFFLALPIQFRVANNGRVPGFCSTIVNTMGRSGIIEVLLGGELIWYNQRADGANIANGTWWVVAQIEGEI